MRRANNTVRPQVRAAITMLELIDILRTFESATRVRQLHRGQITLYTRGSGIRIGTRGCARDLVTPACPTCAVSGCTADRRVLCIPNATRAHWYIRVDIAHMSSGQVIHWDEWITFAPINQFEIVSIAILYAMLRW